MKKLIAAFAFLAAALLNPATAAIETVKFVYEVDFADASVVPATGLMTGSLFKAYATFDTSQIDGNNEVFIPADGSAGSFLLEFGSYVFTQADDLAGGPLIKLPQSFSAFPWLYFDVLFSIVEGVGAGEYLLSFSGTQFQVTPSGNTVDFKMSGRVVPEPSSIALLALAGLGMMGTLVRRRGAKLHHA